MKAKVIKLKCPNPKCKHEWTPRVADVTWCPRCHCILDKETKKGDNKINVKEMKEGN